MVEPTHGLARNALGLNQVLFCIVTGAAPIAAMLFNDPWAVFGGGWAAPSAFIIATIGFTVFSVGYIAMARRVTAAGGFYSFASHGFGQTIGMGVALLIAACYLIFAAGVTGVTAYFANSTIDDWFGVDIPVWVFEFGTVAVMVMFAFFHIELTAKFLGFFLVLELISLLDVRHLRALPARERATSGARCCRGTSSTAMPTAPSRRFGAGTIGVGIFGAFWSWIGFEMAPNYAEESKDPKRIMSPATYISVIGLGILYTFICWMLVVAWGKNGITAGVTRAVQRRHRVGLLSADRPGLPDRHRQRVAAHARVPAHDRDRVVRVSARVLQHGHALPVLDGARGHPAPRDRAHASEVQEPARGGTHRRRPVRADHRRLPGLRLEHARRAAPARHLGPDDGQHRHPGDHGSRLPGHHPVLRDRGEGRARPAPRHRRAARSRRRSWLGRRTC